ncbi:MAG TPA: hypothetical protein VD794_15690 [Flavisolibacter sp.]|nr:hypothetical protein [Flavisolibacter sp.]
MKFLLYLTMSALLFGCAVKREFMADLTDATLIKIDVVSRYPDKKYKMLTWRTTDHIDYITYESITSTAAIGDVMKVLTKR